MKKYLYLIVLFIAVSIIVGAPLVGAVSDVRSNQTEPNQGQDPLPVDWLTGTGQNLTEPNQELDPIPAEWPDETGVMPGLINGKKAEKPFVLIDKTDSFEPQSATATTIDVWYGDTQNFGQKGNPQRWVNILGNVSSPFGVKALSYTLNGGSEQELSMGPEIISGNSRLEEVGDFNIELDIDDLGKSGPTDTVIIKATDNSDAVTTKSVTIDYTPNMAWPENTNIDWDSSANILNIAQPVDGKWAVQNGKLVMSESNTGYDRLIAFGDIGDPGSGKWTEYEVTVPITVKAIDLSNPIHDPGVGIVLRWQGHNAKDGEQPREGWEDIGAIGWYRWRQDGSAGLQQRGYSWTRESSAKEWEFNKTYILKMSVQNSIVAGDTRAYYRLKFWEQGQEEPGVWDLAGFSAPDNSPSGSAMLISHYVHAEFGDVQIRPLSDLSFSLTTSTTGTGRISINPPDQTQFSYAEKVRITAIPAENNYLENWSGDLSVSGEVNPLIFSMTKNMNITANFKQADPGTLAVDIVGQGTVTKDPDKASYEGGELVTLTASPQQGYLFKEWEGALNNTSNPTSVRIDGNTTVKAMFVDAGSASPITDEFNRCALNENVWDFVNPSGNGTVALSEGKLNLTTPAGPTYTIWNENTDAPRIMQDTEDQDFTVDIKFDSVPTEEDQTLGFLVQQDANNWLRFDIHNNGTTLKMFAGVTSGGSGTTKWNEGISLGEATEVYMRVRRIGDTWTQAYSVDGENWQSPQDPTSFNHAMTVSSTGIFAGNSKDSAPTFVLVADYLRNVAFPLDAGGYLLTTKVIGSGAVEVSPKPDASGRYGCNQEVTLQAVPADNFSGWSGDLSGTENPAVLTMNGDKSVTASFGGTTPEGFDVFLPSVLGD